MGWATGWTGQDLKHQFPAAERSNHSLATEDSLPCSEDAAHWTICVWKVKVISDVPQECWPPACFYTFCSIKKKESLHCLSALSSIGNADCYWVGIVGQVLSDFNNSPKRQMPLLLHGDILGDGMWGMLVKAGIPVKIISFWSLSVLRFIVSHTLNRRRKSHEMHEANLLWKLWSHAYLLESGKRRQLYHAKHWLTSSNVSRWNHSLHAFQFVRWSDLIYP